MHAASHDGGLSRPDCLECHKSNIAEEHENNCDKCHAEHRSCCRRGDLGRQGDVRLVPHPGFHAAGFFSNKTDYYAWTTTPGPRDTGTPLGEVGANPANPGAHANYLATTAKCGMCHSVHRAAGAGTKLLPTADATCAGCHVGWHGHHGQAHHVDAVRRQLGADGRPGEPAVSGRRPRVDGRK